MSRPRLAAAGLGLVLMITGCATPVQTGSPSSPASKPEASAKPPETQAPKTAQKAAPTWQEVKTWTGSGIVNTETFTVASKEWRINWETSQENIAGILQVFVYDSKDNLVDLPVNQMGVSKNISYVRKGPGTFYLKINSANIKYRVTVEELR